MILIDEKKTVIAGEAKVVLAELAATTDRFFHTLEKGSDGRISYEEIMEKFTDTILKAKEYREKGKDKISPSEIAFDGLIERDIFEPDRSSELDTNTVDELLKKAAKKLKSKKSKK